MPISEQLYSFLIARPKELSKLYLFAAPFSTDVRFINYHTYVVSYVSYTINEI